MTKLYSVSYNGNNATSGTTPPAQVAESTSDAYTFVAPTAEQYGLAKAGYGLLGWAEDPNTIVAQYVPNSSIELTEAKPSITLYAVWMNWNSATLMQSVNAAVCTTTDIGETKQLTDTRDSKQYWVAKLADGNCWMTQNLDLDIPTSGLKASDTDLENDWTAYDETTNPNGAVATITEVLSAQNWPNTNNIVRSWDPALGGDPTYCNSGTESSAGNCKASGNPTTSVNDGHDAQGNYYSWCAATAGCRTKECNDPVANEDAASSICPKGWRLPSDANSTSADKRATFKGLQSAYNMGATGRIFINSPLYFIYSGYISSNVLDNAGRYGFYWSSTANGGTNAYDLSFGSSGVTPSDTRSRYWGMPVRCVAR